ncbi:MAG: histidinol-phosphate transaminase, partial [Deltaproteobacteria bacterium]|nr:histidinol-phosphate transaminase [Deltaproteobacteria bacterium]
MFSERLKRLSPYVPGEQPRDRRYLKLNTNENPYPPSPTIREVLRNFDPETLRLYPDPLFTDLREMIGKRFEIDPAQVFVGNGSDEVLSLAFFSFFDTNRGPLLFPEHTYSFYPVYCDFYGIGCIKIPLARDFSLNPDGFLNVETSCGIVFANPNAPTGMFLEVGEIRRLLESYLPDSVVIVDEAYIDFGAESALPLVKEFPNLLIIRTFSKGMSLAGLRLGYAMGSRELIDALYRAKDSFNSYPVDTLSLLIGVAAMQDEAYYKEVTERIIATRERLSRDLQRSGWRVLPSRANFVFASREGIPGKEVYRRLKEKGILVRYFDIEGIRDFVRITIGT